MRITQGGSVRRYYVDGGFVQVAGNIVSVLTGRAISLEKIDAQAARDQLTEALSKPANSPELMALRDRAVAQSRAQIRLASKAK